MKRLGVILLTAITLVSCSTVNLVPEGRFRLNKNEVEVIDEKHIRSTDLSPYIRQESNSRFLGMSPLVSIYGWSQGKDKGIAKVWRKIGEPPVIYDPEMVTASVENIKFRLGYLGYYHPSISTKEKFIGKKVNIQYIIKPGARILIDSVEYAIPSDRDFAELFSKDSTNIIATPGEYLSEDLMERESIRAASFFRENGYYQFSKSNYFFKADTLTKPGKAILSYSIKPYTRGSSDTTITSLGRFKFGSVHIYRPKDMNFRESVLKRMNTIKPGNWFSDQEVNKTYTRLSALRVFNSVVVETSPKDSNLVETSINLSRSKDKGFKINFEASATYTGLYGLAPQVSFFHKNLFNGGEWFNLGFTGNFQIKPKERTNATEFGANANLSLPKVLIFDKWARNSMGAKRTEFKASFNFQNRPEFKRRVFALNFGYSGISKHQIQYQIYPIQINATFLKDISPDYIQVIGKNPLLYYSYSDHFDLGAGVNLYYTSCNDIVPTVSYHYYRVIAESSGNFLSLFNNVLPQSSLGQRLVFNLPYSQYVRGEFVFGKNWRFGARNGQALALRADVGVANGSYGNYFSTPFEKQFYVGGANSMRGWQARCLGPGGEQTLNFFTIPSQSGEVKLEFDLEYRFKMFWKIEGALFAETGNIWMLPSSGYADENLLFRFNSFYKTLAGDWGVGLRLNLNFIVLRFDFGMKVHDPSKSEGRRWIGPDKWFTADGNSFHFGVGYPF